MNRRFTVQILSKIYLYTASESRSWRVNYGNRARTDIEFPVKFADNLAHGISIEIDELKQRGKRKARRCASNVIRVGATLTGQ